MARIDPGYEGYADLGSVLMGAGVDKGAAFAQGAQRQATLHSALATAKLKRQKLQEREQLRQHLPPGPEGDMMASIMLGELGSQYSATVQGMGRQQQNDARQLALDAPMPGTEGYTDATPDALNQALAVATGRQLTPRTVKVIPQVHSEIGRKNAAAAANAARAEAGEAQADAHRARAERTRKMPLSGSRSKKVPTSVEEPIDGDVEATPKKATKPAAPGLKIGEVRKGYRYTGGNPADRNNWELE